AWRATGLRDPDSSRDLDVLPEPDPVIDFAHGGAWRFVGPRCSFAACCIVGNVVELDPVRAGQIALCLRRGLQQVHANRLPRKVRVAAHIEGPIALGDDPTTPYCLHGDLPSRLRPSRPAGAVPTTRRAISATLW